MVITPNSKIILIKSPLKLDNYNQITFGDATAQYNYFHGLTHLEYDNCTYQRKDDVIRYATDSNLTYEDLLQYNYCMYQNTSYDSKWFYAFITDCKYVNDGITEIRVETDVFQTWQFDLVYMNSFIEREHVSDDTIGLHTIPEGLETGEYVVNNKIDKHSLQYIGFLVGATIDLSDNTFPNIAGGNYNKVYSGIKYFYYGTSSDLNAKLKAVADAGKSDAITCLFAVPTTLISTTDNVVNNSNSVTEQDWAYAVFGGEPDVTPTKPTTLNGYTPKNNKLKTYPYMFLNVSNNSGGDTIYHYELFSGNNTDFKLYSALTPGMSIRLVPKNYNGVALNNQEGINLGKFPICNWNTDVYTNWLTQNGVNIGLSVASNVVTIAGGVGLALTGAGGLAGGGAIVSGSMGIAQTLGEVYQHSLIPPQSEGNINSGDVNFANGNLTFTLYQKSIKYEYAKIIDDFFTMYGYKVNRLATPNIHKRSNWDYIKTIDVNIEGNVPEKDLDKIRKLFNDGCTFWHTTSNYLDYSQTNSILT
jgi:hypothetical protein